MRALVALTRHPGILLSLGLGLVALLLGAALPPPSNWTRSAGDKLVDLRTTNPLDWHPTVGAWTIDPATIATYPSTWIPWRSCFLSGALSFAGFERSQPVLVSLEDASSHVVLATESTSTPLATPLSGLSTGHACVVFHDVEPGDYVLRTKILDEEGNTLAEEAQQLDLVPQEVVP